MDLNRFWLPRVPKNLPLYLEVSQNQVATSLDRAENMSWKLHFPR